MHKDISNLPDDAVAKVRQYLLNLQTDLCKAFESLDGKATFHHDAWQREEGGGGITKVLTNGNIFEKGGVNFSHVFGQKLPLSASASRPDMREYAYQALGVSIVMHPDSPFIPTTHANVRFFFATKDDAKPLWWFGGGFDLTPYYGFVEDCKHWHQTAQAACAPFGDDLYARFKHWCDQYFYIPHRREARGIGGLFFDDYHEHSFEHSFQLMQSVGNHFIKAYAPIVLRRKDLTYTAAQKAFQCQRRGRYVEYNLIYDRGTLFGLQSGGRTESILMSLPPAVSWEYQAKPEPGSLEATLYENYLPARDWLT